MDAQASLIINQPDSTVCPKIYEKLDSGQISTHNLVEWVYGWFKHPFHGWLKHPFQSCTNQIHTFVNHDSTRQRRMGGHYFTRCPNHTFQGLLRFALI